MLQVLGSQILSGKLFHTFTTECLKPRDANTVPTALLQIKLFVEDRREVRSP